MCLVIAVILGVFAFNAIMAGKISLGLLSVAGSLFFIFLMLRNISHVRKLRRDKDELQTDPMEESSLDKHEAKRENP